MARIVAHRSNAELEARYRASQDATEARRFQAIWLLAQGRTVLEVAEVLAFVPRWVAQPAAGQDDRGIKGRIRCMRGFKSFPWAERFCRSHDELRNFLRLRTRHNQIVPADRRRWLRLSRVAAALAIPEAV